MESVCLSVFLPHGQVEAERLQENTLSLAILFVDSSRTVMYGHVKFYGRCQSSSWELSMDIWRV